MRVTKSLLNELYSNLRWDSEVYSERVDAICTRVAMALNTNATSPLNDRIIVSNKDKSRRRCLTLTSFNDGLRNEGFFGREGKYGPFCDSTNTNWETTKVKATAILHEFFEEFRTEVESNWQLGDAKGGYLCTNNGIRALLMVLGECLEHISRASSIDLDTLDAEDIQDDIAKLTTPIVEFFKNASPSDIELFRSRQALKGVRGNALRMMSFVHDEIPAFLPASLRKFLESTDEVGTDEARKLIDEIQRRLNSYTLESLRDHFPEGKEWWYEGVPDKIKVDCAGLHQEEHGIKEPEQYLCLINYRDIAVKSWILLGPLFSLGEKGGKHKVTEWLKRLNTVRNITHHIEKWPATKDQVKMVREIHAKVMQRFEELGLDS